MKLAPQTESPPPSPRETIRECGSHDLHHEVHHLDRDGYRITRLEQLNNDGWRLTAERRKDRPTTGATHYDKTR